MGLRNGGLKAANQAKRSANEMLQNRDFTATRNFATSYRRSPVTVSNVTHFDSNHVTIIEHTRASLAGR
jgi:hypothetical protein